MAAESPPVEILPWLRSLPVAPEYHPTLSEFQDPIAYILKIEKEASAYGICKIVPPIPAAPKKTAFANLNKSFAAHLPSPSPRPNPSPDSNSKRSPTFSTRHQQIGFCHRRPRSVQKPVWQSGDRYTLTQFEAKAKHFELSYLSKFTPMAAAASYCSSSRKKKKNKFKNRQKKSSKMSLSPLSALQIETLYWKACSDKPFSVEYANDIPGSGFPPIVGVTGKRWREDEVADNLAETAWNMRGVSRAKGSLLRFMKEEIPGVTSPMVYVAMLFSWFAWHVEDHELHSLNYLHLGAGKTWYGVPRDAALAFEDVVRVHGYCGEVNPLMTFTILGEKTTVMSPEVLIDAGIPCCRLVQNAGEFVITFPGAYHCGFSHGFNCGEAANIATPRWLRVAKEAAIRRASTNYPPMVSHFQLLYALALSLCSRMPLCGNNEPRSSRIKDKLSGEGELIIKKTFVQSVVDNNALLSYLLEKGSSCIVLPQITEDSPLSSSSLIRSQLKVKPRLSLKLCSREEALEASRALPTDDINLDMNTGMKHLSDFSSLKGNSVAVYHRKKHTVSSNDKFVTSEVASSILELHSLVEEKERNLQGDGLLDQGLLSCVTCGILSFACVAVVEPREAAARYLTSACGSFLIEQHTGSEEISVVAHDTNLQSSNICSGRLEGEKKDRLDENTVYTSKYSTQILDPIEVASENSKQKGTSALDLLASVYGDESSDSDNEQLPHETSVCTQESYPKELLLSHKLHNDHVATKLPDLWFGKVPYSEVEHELIGANCQNAVPAENFRYTTSDDLDNLSERADDRYLMKLESSRCCKPEYKDSLLLSCMEENGQVTNSSNSIKSLVGEIDSSNKELGSCYHTTGTLDVHRTNMKTQSTTPCSNNFPLCADPHYEIDTHCENAYISTQLKKYHSDMKKVAIDVMHGSDKDSSRMHVFCLQHAMEVERKLCSVGGIHIMLLCHPDYPKIEAEAKALAVELGIDYEWKNIDFREATLKDQERIQAALKDEESIPTNSDWAVKLGINLYYSASLSKSPLYSKQMPYNAVIYKSFSFNSPNNTTVKTKGFGRPGRQKKIVVAGKWCGSIWMSNQVHPFLVQRKDAQDEEAEEVPFTHGCIANSNSIIGSESKGSSANDSSTVSRKPGKRKKRPLRKANGKKPKLSQSTDILNAIEDDVKVYNTSRGRILRSNNKLKNKDEPERGPSSRLKRRSMRSEDTKVVKPVLHKQNERKATGGLAPKSCDDDDEGEYTCDIDGCYMSFSTKQELSLHKRNICPFKGCGKKLFSHKYMLQHRKVHMDYRPLECPWKGCKMTFKWAWARTEHIRVHTGDRPYICHEPGCSQTFRFVSDFSRHKRKTGHSVKKFRRC